MYSKATDDELVKRIIRLDGVSKIESSPLATEVQRRLAELRAELKDSKPLKPKNNTPHQDSDKMFTWVGPYGPACSEPSFKCSRCGHWEDLRNESLPDKCPACGRLEK